MSFKISSFFALAAFGGYQDFVPLALNGDAEDPLTVRLPVDTSGIEIIDAQFNARAMISGSGYCPRP